MRKTRAKSNFLGATIFAEADLNTEATEGRSLLSLRLPRAFPVQLTRVDSTWYVQHAAPARLIDEVQSQVSVEREPIANRSLLVLIFRRLK